MLNGFFITATDTGVGKTVLTAALAARLRDAGRDVVALKPFASGAVREDGRRLSADAVFLEQAARSGEAHEAICPVLLDAPLAPSVAAKLEGRTLDVPAVVAHCRKVGSRHELTLVEGVGGLLVPLTDEVLVADFAVSLGLPLIVVARPSLGTLNHTALTIEAAQARGLEVAGIVISGRPASADLAVQTNPEVLERMTGCRILATLPAADGLDVDAGRRGDWASVVSAVDPDLFLQRL